MKNRWRPLHSWSLKWKSVLLLLALVTLPTVLIGSMIYYQSNNIVKQQAIDTTEQNLNNMGMNLASIMEDVEDVSRYMIYSEDFRRYMTLSPHTSNDYLGETDRLRRSIQAFLTFHLTNKRYFNSVTIEGVNGHRLHVGDRVSGNEFEWDRLAMEQKGRVVWTEPYVLERGGFDMDNAHVVSLFRVINDLYSIVEPVGKVAIRLDANALYNDIVGNYLDDQQETFLLRHNGVVMFHPELEYLGAPYPDPHLLERILSAPSPVFTYDKENGETYYVVTRNMKNTDYMFVSLVRDDYILDEVAGIRTTMNVMLAVFGGLGLLVILGFVLAIVRPILELTKETKRLEDGDFTARVQVRSRDEIGTLGMRFNKAVSYIERLIDTKYKLEIQSKEAELKALQSQINPHFLYNTLDMIRWTARLEGAKETGKSIEDFSRLFRINLSQGKLWIPLQDEMKYVQSYLELQKKRMLHPLSYLTVMEAGLEKALVMKIMLQPLAENSIQHGFGQSGDNNRLYIRAYRMGSDVWIDVIDNGKGMDAERMNQLLQAPAKGEQQPGFALKNIRDRIASTFGPSYGLNIIPTEKGHGAYVRVRLPYVEREEDLELMLQREESKDDAETIDRR